MNITKQLATLLLAHLVIQCATCLAADPSVPIVQSVAVSTDQSCPDEAVDAAARHASVKIEAGAQEVVAAFACKVWPHDPSLLLAAFAFRTSADDKKFLVVSVLDRSSYRVLSSHQELVEEDWNKQYGAGSLKIDTGRYQLAEHVRAFGVRFDTTGTPPTCADGAFGTELMLFVPGKGELKKVLSSMPLYSAVAETGCFSSNLEKLEYSDANLTLSVAKTITNGWADLTVTASIGRTTTNGWSKLNTAAKIDPSVNGKAKTTVERATLKYDGQRYRSYEKTPWWLTIWQQ